MTDLRTTYLGLELRSPDRGLGRPADAGAGDRPAAGGRGRRRDRAAVAVRGGDRPRGGRARPRPSKRAPSTSPRRSTTSRGFREIDSVLDRYLATISELKEALEIPVIASLNATTTGGWIRYAQLLAERRRRRASSSTSTGWRPTPSATRRGCRGRRPAVDRRRRGGRRPARGRQAGAVLHGDGQLRPPGGRGRRPGPGALQPLLPARPRPRDPRRGAEDRPQPALGAAPAAALDRDPPPAARPGRLAGRHVRRPLGRRRRQGAAGRAPTWP